MVVISGDCAGVLSAAASVAMMTVILAVVALHDCVHVDTSCKLMRGRLQDDLALRYNDNSVLENHHALSPQENA